MLKKQSQSAEVKKMKISPLEWVVEKIIGIFGFTSIIIIGLIFLFLFQSGGAFFNDVSLKDFLFGKNWFPISVNPQYGILPLLTGSLMVTAMAIVIAVPMGIASAIYISEIAPPRIRMTLKVIVEILSAIPSVVLGFLGIIVLSAWVKNFFDLPSGFTALTGSILVALMALPTIISISDDAINAVPRHYREASYALGATKWETIKHVLVPAASSGIVAAVMLGIGRAIGETMTVMMVTGNAAMIAKSPLQSARTMTATIAAEMGDTVRQSTHYHALFAVGLMLLLMTTLINIVAESIVHKAKKEGR